MVFWLSYPQDCIGVALEEIRDLKSNDTLLKDTGGKVLYAGWMSGKWDFYADAYKEAADRLVDQIQENWAPDDRLILPAIFMYRHFVELKLKWIIIHLQLFSGTKISKFNIHDIWQLWIYVKDHLSCLDGGKLEKNTENNLDRIIKELSTLDPTSYYFRYSHDNQDQDIPLPERLSMENFKDVMEGLKNGFALIEGGIDYEKEMRAFDAEIQAELYSYMNDLY